MICWPKEGDRPKPLARQPSDSGRKILIVSRQQPGVALFKGVAVVAMDWGSSQ
jgi:hypothetical protein